MAAQEWLREMTWVQEEQKKGRAEQHVECRARTAGGAGMRKLTGQTILIGEAMNPHPAIQATTGQERFELGRQQSVTRATVDWVATICPRQATINWAGKNLSSLVEWGRQGTLVVRACAANQLGRQE